MHEAWLESLDLGIEKAEGTRIRDFQARKGIWRQLLVRLPQFDVSMRVGTILPVVAGLSLRVKLARLRLVIVIWDVEHFILYVQRQLLRIHRKVTN